MIPMNESELIRLIEFADVYSDNTGEYINIVGVDYDLKAFTGEGRNTGESYFIPFDSVSSDDRFFRLTLDRIE